MENKPSQTSSTSLQNEVINITSVELKEITKKDGGTFKQYAVHVQNQPKGIHYSLPIKKAPTKNADGSLTDNGFTRAYEFYRDNKSKWEDLFVADQIKPVAIAYAENTSNYETKDGKKGTSTYRTIRMMREPEPEDLQNTAITLPDLEEDMFPVNEIPM